MPNSFPSPTVLTTCDELQRHLRQRRAEAKTLGLVPTMGALHEGHLSLVREANAECDATIVSIFVNPTQFGPGEDFQQYPRTLESDLRALSTLDVDSVFVPAGQEMYPPGFSTYVQPPAVAEPLEGSFRAGHFQGVATVVLKLFHLIPADFAYFGQKDYQQLTVLRRMVADLNVPITLRECPIVREPDGLALSSRNRYLSDDERQRALALSRSLARARELVAEGERNTARLRQEMHEIFREHRVTEIDYITIVDPDTMATIAFLEERAVAVIAARVGKTRLIDNCYLEIA